MFVRAPIAQQPRRQPQPPGRPAAAVSRALQSRAAPRAPVDRLATQLRTAVAKRAMVQRYTEFQDNGGDDWRVSDDTTILTGADYPNHALWAKEGLAADANVKLKGVGSGIELVETADEYEYPDSLEPGLVLKRIEAKNTVNKTQGDDMLLYADCGRSASLVVGGSNRRAMYALRWDSEATEHIDESNPALMKIGIMRNWLTDQIKLRTPAPEPGDTTDVDGMKAALAAGDKLDVDLKALSDESKKWTKATKKLVRDAWRVKYNAKLKETATAYFAYFDSLPVSQRDKIAATLEIDHFARPEIGQGFTTSSGGAKIKGKSTWNFHWGGVVMKSEDDADVVVLENYSVSKWDEENENWTFDLYGTKRKDQTFHGRHKATGQHGESPTTMVIEKRP
jgi:hypothetical protein